MDEKCTIYRTMDIVGKRWTLLILLELYKGRAKWKRYSVLKGSLLDITPKIFSARLKELQAQGMISKRVDASTVPVKSEYSLTTKGNDFIKIVKDIKKWAFNHGVKNKLCQSQNCKECKL